jgi:hypothetical protein
MLAVLVKSSRKKTKNGKSARTIMRELSTTVAEMVLLNFWIRIRDKVFIRIQILGISQWYFLTLHFLVQI